MRNVLIFILFIFLAIPAFAQVDGTQPTIKRSTDKVKIDGKYYYIHIVQKGETLYSISRSYNVSQSEIATENPDIYLGIKVDQALKIPIKDQQILEADEDENYVYHVVRRRETLFALSRKYQIPIEDIIAANPEVEQGLKVNQVVLIPKKKVESLGQASPEQSERFIYHEVKPREGFFAITRRYNVTEEVIRRFNEDLVKDGIKLGTILRIPRNPNDTVYIPEPIPFERLGLTPEVIEEKHLPRVPCDTFVYNRWRDKFNIALILPFTHGVEETPSVDDFGNITQGTNQPQGDAKISQLTANFLDFYQGALIAIDSLKREGMSINLNVYNTSKDARTAKALTKEQGVRDAQLIIGPVYPECIKPIAEFALENRIPMVSPLSQNNQMLERNPQLFQVNPSFITQLEEFAKQIEICTSHNIIILYEDDSTAINLVNSFKPFLDQRIASCRVASALHYKEVRYKPGSPAPQVQEIISHSLSLDKENLIIVPSNSEAFVSDLLGNLHTLSTIHKYPIAVHGLPRWQRFRNVQVEYFYQLQLTLFTPYFVNYKNPEVKSFLVKYRDAFRSEPTQYSFQGYDVVYYFLSAMKSYGVDFQHCLPYHNVNLLQSKYQFQKMNSLNGYENRAIHLIQYTKDFDILQLESQTPPTPALPLQYINEPGSGRKEGVIIR